ncbi:hypothetical protein L083_1372 [Actinoplanes sp. N902-109]|nr:hypothetical protein L083_1372 [Actinoplanes sp. N902-109]
MKWQRYGSRQQHNGSGPAALSRMVTGIDLGGAARRDPHRMPKETLS